MPNLRDFLTIDEGRGRVELFGQRIWLSHLVEFASFLRAQEIVMGSAAKGLVYAAGEEIGAGYYVLFQSTLADQIASRDGRGRFEVCLDWLSRLGYGRFRVVDIDQGTGTVRLTLTDSIEAESYGPAKGTVCYSIAGCVASIAAKAWEARTHCRETRCASAGASRCEFEVNLRATDEG